MILIPRVRRNGTVDLAIVLEQENIDRIKQYDQAEVLWPQLPPIYSMRKPNCIAVCFATSAEIAQINEWIKAGELQKALDLVSRGFKFQPDKGDHDFGPISMTKKTKKAN